MKIIIISLYCLTLLTCYPCFYHLLNKLGILMKNRDVLILLGSNTNSSSFPQMKDYKLLEKT